MDTHSFAILRSVLAVAAGGVIGYAFGLLQDAARRRNEQLAIIGQVKSGWTLMPGAGARVAYFVVTLALIQLICPLLFEEGTQWVVSGGVALGYGWTLIHHLRQRMAGRS